MLTNFVYVIQQIFTKAFNSTLFYGNFIQLKEVGLMSITFEDMTVTYGKEILDIFNYYVEHSYAAYLEKTIPYEFAERFIAIPQGYPAYIIKDSLDKKVIGFCFLKPYSSLSVFEETAEITYFIKKDQLGKGVGKLALNLLEKEGRKRGIKKILASISSYNESSIQFHLKNGFSECGKFHDIGKKKGNNFDVVWMEKAIE